MKKELFICISTFLLVQMAYSQKNAKPIISSHNFSNKTELWESVHLQKC